MALLGLASLLAFVAAGCGGSKKSSSPKGGSSCKVADLNLVKSGQLTIGTDNPAFPPWFGGTPPKGSVWKVSDPNSGQGFESAVAYAVAGKLGFKKDDVHWVVVPFEQSFKPGSKNFDFDANQISFTPARAKSVDFSNSYYDVNQALVGLKGKPITMAKTTAEVKKYKLGAQIGTTSYDYIKDFIRPSQTPGVYDSNNDAISALNAGQIDGIVVDLPTAFYVVAVQLDDGTIVGKLPQRGPREHFGMVFGKGSSLVRCVNRALGRIWANGTIGQLQKKYLAQAGAPDLR